MYKSRGGRRTPSSRGANRNRGTRNQPDYPRRTVHYGLIGVAAFAVVAAAAAIAIAALGSSSDSARKASGCAILDVSESTQDVRGLYTEEFNRFATEIGNDGTGDLCVILAAADPFAETSPRVVSVAPLASNVGKPKGPVEIEEKVLDATREVADLLGDPPVEEKGSGLIEAASVVARELHPGDRIIYLTDGLQWTRGVGHLVQMDLSEKGIAETLARLRRRGLLPDLRGVEVEFPRMLYRPEGIDVDPAQKARILVFWERWAEATGAKLSYDIQTN